MKRRNPTIATVVIDVTRRNAKPQIDCDLVPDELQAIGLITVQWAHLEHCLYFRCCSIAETLGIALPDDVHSLSFTRRLKAFRNLAKRMGTDRQKWETIADRIANAEGLRHKVTHGLWSWDTSNDDELAAVVSFRPPHKFDVRIDVSRLRKLSVAIGELLFELSFPGGAVEALMTAAPIPPRSKKYRPSSTTTAPKNNETDG